MIQNEIQDKVIRYNEERERGRGIECLWGLDSLSLLGQDTIIAWDRTCWRVSRTFYPVCETRLLSFVSVRSWLSREKVWAGLKRMYAHILDYLGRGSWQNWHVWNSSTPACGFAGPRHDNTLFSKPKVPARTPLGIVQTFYGVSIIARGQYLPLIEFDAETVTDLELGNFKWNDV